MFIILGNSSVKLSVIPLEDLVGFERIVTERRHLLSGCFMKSGSNFYGIRSQQILIKEIQCEYGRCISFPYKFICNLQPRFLSGFPLEWNNGSQIQSFKN